MIARTQHIRHGHILKDLWPREVRILQQARRKTFVVSGFLFSHEAGDEPGRGLHQHHGGGLPAVEHGLAHADLLDRQNVHEPGVDAFIPTAHQRQRLFPRQLAGQRLRERLTGGGEHDDPPRSAPLRFQFPQGLYQRFQHHDHAGPAAIRTVVHDMVAVFRPVAGVQDIEFDKPRLARLAEQRRIQRGCKPFREQSQYINSHCFVLYEDWGRGEKPF